MEASKATGLSVLDADRLVAEMRLPVKVRGVLGYAPEVDEVLRTRPLHRSSASSAMQGRHSWGYASHSWGRSPTSPSNGGSSPKGTLSGSGDVLCEVRLIGLFG